MTQTATLAGGCFWCLDAVYEQLRGVKNVLSGYTGGEVENPNYHQVCGGRTGHAEVVRIEFDPEQVSFRELLEIFFTIHDPTTLNRQGADTGTQYRSAIFYENDEQKRVAEEVMEEISREGIWDSELVTQLEPLGDFYPGEDYHQGYYRKNPSQSYCRVIIQPKVAKFRKQFLERLTA
jgi:peptide-methionine (S)-S-oxide reductase